MGESTSTAALTPEKANVVAKRHRQQRQGGGEPRATRLRDALPLPTRVTVRGVEVEIRELTLQDLAELEAQGHDTGEVTMTLQAGGVQALRYLVWLLLRQSEPDLTLEEAGQLVPFEELQRVGEGGLIDTLLLAAGLRPEPDPNAEGASPAPSTGN